MTSLIHFLNLLTAGQLAFFTLGLGIIEFSFGLYEHRWTKNERYLDLACFLLPRLVLRPATAYLIFQFMSVFFAASRNAFQWVPFFWGFFIICMADDVTQYWYHRLHHEIPWLWRFPSRQNLLYTFFFSQTYVISALVYLGLGAPAILVGSIKGLITTLAHSSIPWDKPLYKYRALHPIAWVVERLISTPATHHAHHAAATDDGIGYYKGNFGNMFFLWDVIFGTALITRQYPETYGVSHCGGDEWYAQLLWPILKSSVTGSELAAGGPMVREDS